VKKAEEVQRVAADAKAERAKKAEEMKRAAATDGAADEEMRRLGARVTPLVR